MVVALLGIGADSTNTDPVPPVYPDGTFEYIPIPERNGPEGTVEELTYATRILEHQDAPSTEYVERITPEPGGEQLARPEFESWPFHHDPNFDALTYGETTSRGAYTKLLRQLSEGDLVAFYTGLRDEASRFTHRYIIGYFTVATVYDLERMPYDGTTVSFSQLPIAERNRFMEEHRNNAHAKRYLATGEIVDGDGLVITDGKRPGGLLERAFPISTHAGGPHHYLTEELHELFEPEPRGNPDRTAYLGGIKQAHLLNIESEELIEIID